MKPFASALLIVGLALMPLAARADAAQDFPTRPIEILVPYAAGGVGDVLSRVVGERVSAILGQPVVVVSRPGGNSNIATLAVLRAAADGHTWLMSSPSLAANPSMYPGLWDTAKDFTTIGIVATAPSVITVPAASPHRTLADFVTAARRAPGQFNYGNPAIGSSMHLNTELLSLAADMKLVSVVYKGQPAVVPDLIRGELAIALLSVGLAVPQIESGRLRALAVVSQRRIKQLPDVPTIAETGYPEANAVPHYGFVISSKTPKEIAQRINATISRVLAQPEVQEKLRSVGLDPEPPRDLQASQSVLQGDATKYAEIIRRAAIKVE